MSRQVHHLEQGSPEWHAHRATPGQINGSEIAAIMGLSSYVSRAELIRRKATGIEPEYDAATLKRFADGHANEALARPWAEAIIDDDLSPLVMTDTIDGVLISVSLDGITQGYDTTFEHKSLNITLADALDAGVLPDEYHPQCEAGLMVSGATRCLFMASKDGDGSTARHYWYESNPALRPKIIAACKQFLEDVANYVHVETVAAPVAATIEALPALFVQVEGKVLATNLDAFKAAAQTFIDGIKTELVNDQDFADADKMVKFLKDGEDRLAQAKQHALAQTASIDELFRTVDAISEQMRSKRLALDKLVKAEKVNRKAAIISDARQALDTHVAKLNERIGGRWVPSFSDGRFAEAVGGLKSLDSMRDKVSTALANAKIEANEIADTIEANHNSLLIGTENDTSHLFPDFAQVCTKAREDFAALHAMRIQQEAVRKEAERQAVAAREAAAVAAAVEAERKASDARAAEAARIAAAAEAAKAQQNAQEASVAAGQLEGVAQEAPALSKEPTGEAAMPGGSGATGAKGIASTGLTAQPVSTINHFSDSGNMVVSDPDAAMIDDFIRLLSIAPVAKKALRADIVAWETYRIKTTAARGLAAAA